MAKHNRHLRESTDEVLIDVHGNTVVDAGDLMFIDRSAGVRGAGNAPDDYAYPFEAATAINGVSTATAVFDLLEPRFIGIAMESSPTGVTEKISIATAGIFKMPMPGITGVTLGSLISAVSPAATIINSTQVAGESSTGYNASCLLGYVTKSQASPATYVEFEMRTQNNKGVAT